MGVEMKAHLNSTFHLTTRLKRGSTVFTLESTLARTDTIVTSTSTHATTRAGLGSNSATVFSGIGAVDDSSITRNTDITLLAADNRLAANTKGKLSATTRSTARMLEAERGLGSGTLGVKGTSEALGTRRSTETLETGKSSI